MTVIADLARPLFFERNVTLSHGLRTKSAFDLALYPAMGRRDIGVLIATVIGVVEFIDGEEEFEYEVYKKKYPDLVAPASQFFNPKFPRKWGAGEKQVFISEGNAIVSRVWSGQHILTPSNDMTEMKKIHVQVDCHLKQGWGLHSHWNVAVKKYPPFYKTRSFVRAGTAGAIDNGEVNLNMIDIYPEDLGGPTKFVTIAHEFGHVLGMRDEYLEGTVPADVPWFVSDTASIMNRGNVVRPRHYVLFATWLDKAFRSGTLLRGLTPGWRVGEFPPFTTVANAGIG